MQPEDTVLVAIMNNERDFAIARDAGWYRIPAERAPEGIHAQYLAFYQTRSFGDDAFAINYYGRINGVELVQRRDLFPDEPNHPRADQPYYKILLGPLVRLPHPIISRKWRRITFLVTTGERFQKAWELNDLVLGASEEDVVWRAIREFGREQNEIREPRQAYQTPSPLWYAFTDESGDTSLFAAEHPFLAIGTILTRSPRPMALHVTHTLKKLGVNVGSGELKAARLLPQITFRFLAKLAQEDIAIVGIVLDKRVIVRPPTHAEDLYRTALSLLATICVMRHSRLEWHLDKRYTSLRETQDLERMIRQQIADLKQESVLIFPEESHMRKELQAADMVAWALAQKYQGRDDYWKLLERKVVVEEVIRQEAWQ